MSDRLTTERSIRLTQLEFDAVTAAVDFERRALLAVGDQEAADERLVLLAVLRAEWGERYDIKLFLIETPREFPTLDQAIDTELPPKLSSKSKLWFCSSS